MWQDWDFGPEVRLAREIAKAQDRRLVCQGHFTPEAKVPSFERVPRLHNDVGVAENQVHAEPRRQPLLSDAKGKDQNGVRAACVVVLRYGSQPVVE